MSCAQDWNYHSTEPRKQRGNGIQTAACQILICLPVVVRAADNIHTLCDISGSTWQDEWEGTCHSKRAVLSHSSVSSVLTAGTVTPHVSAHLYISVPAFSAVRRKPDNCIFACFIILCYWDITHVGYSYRRTGRKTVVLSPLSSQMASVHYRVINVNKYVLVSASGRVFMHLFQSMGCYSEAGQHKTPRYIRHHIPADRDLFLCALTCETSHH